MVTERLTVAIDERGAFVTSRAINGIGKAAKTSGKQVDLLRKTLGLFGGIIALRTLIDFADTFLRLENQVRVVNDGVGNLNETMERLFVISSKTRTAIEGNVQLFQRLSFASKELGASQEDLFRFVETTGKLLAIQGGSAQAARGALIQLTQAMGSGIVRGEEFNSILEGAFSVALAAAKGLDAAGGSVSKLRTLVIQGKVSSEEFFKAILSQSDAADKTFAQIRFTLAQTLVQLRNNAIQLVGDFNAVTGVFRGTIKVVEVLSNNLNVLVQTLSAVGIGFLIKSFGPLTLKAIAIVTIAIKRLVVALGPIGLAVTVLTSLAFAAENLTGGLFKAEGATVKLSDIMTATFNVGKKLVKELDDAVRVVEVTFGVVAKEIGGIRSVLAKLFNFMVTTVDKIIGIFAGMTLAIKVAIETSFENLPATMVALLVKGLNLVIKEFEKSANFIFSVMRKLGIDIADVTFGKFVIDGSKAAKDVIVEMDKAFQKGLNFKPVEKLVSLISTEAIKVAKLREAREKASAAREEENEVIRKAIELAKKQATAIQKLIDILNPFGKALREEKENIELLNLALKVGKISLEDYTFLMERLGERSAIAVRDALEELNPHLERQRILLEEIREPAKTYAETLEDINALLGQEAINEDQAARSRLNARIAFLDAQTTASAGAERFLLKFNREVEDFAGNTEKLLTDAFDSAGDALSEFLETGKVDFRSFVNDIAADLLRLGLRELLGSLSGASGNGAGIGGAVVGGVKALGQAFAGSFNHGGSFTVGAGNSIGLGSGIDNRLTSIKTNDGERVTITPRGENLQGSISGAVTAIFNFPPGTDVEGFRRSESQISARTSALLRRANRRNN